jgi:hypothetical protein
LQGVAGSEVIGAPSSVYIDMNTSPRGGWVLCKGTSVPGIGQARRSPSP